MTFALLLLAVAGPAFRFNGRATAGLGTHYLSPDWFGRLAAEYRPQAQLAFAGIDAEVSARAAADLDCRLLDSLWHDWSLKPYRAFLRCGAERFEVRAGLQQLNFGSATMLRPLRWFDRLDPRDPLRTTEGVSGLLGRGYPGNSSVWLWGLLGNFGPKGTETTPTPRWFPEAGGRVELALPHGEAAASAHFRRTILENLFGFDTVGEQKLGLDAKWDVGIGLWTEGMLLRVARPGRDAWTRQAMVGADYTFGIGSGLTLVAEHMVSGSAPAAFQGGFWQQFSALSLAYPLGILDNLQAFVFFDWSKRRSYSYLGWQRNWDNWILLVAGFWDPDGAGDRGATLTVVFSH
uniref:DUF3187 family protein n=1 Tax=candidate division WOR-3 bacterium TaxID=2052148 RepID=A0A7C4CC56_UNCW3